MSLVMRFGERAAADNLRSGRKNRHARSARDALRARLTQEIEERIALLDALDGDPDDEPAGDDEPSLGWLTSGGHSWRDGNIDLEDKDAAP